MSSKRKCIVILLFIVIVSILFILYNRSQFFFGIYNHCTYSVYKLHSKSFKNHSNLVVDRLQDRVKFLPNIMHDRVKQKALTVAKLHENSFERQNFILTLIGMRKPRRFSVYKQCPRRRILTVLLTGKLGNVIWEYMSMIAVEALYSDRLGMQAFLPGNMKRILEILFERMFLRQRWPEGTCDLVSSIEFGVDICSMENPHIILEKGVDSVEFSDRFLRWGNWKFWKQSRFKWHYLFPHNPPLLSHITKPEYHTVWWELPPRCHPLGLNTGHGRSTMPAQDRFLILLAHWHMTINATKLRSVLLNTTDTAVQHRIAQRAWATKHTNWRDDDWNRCLFTDESKIVLHASDGRVLTWIDTPQLIDLPGRCVSAKYAHVVRRQKPPRAKLGAPNDSPIILDTFSCRHNDIIRYGIKNFKQKLTFKKYHLRSVTKVLLNVKKSFGFYIRDEVTFVSVHFRGGDYNKSLYKYYPDKFKGPPSFRFYHNAMQYFNRTMKNVIFLFISIDTVWLHTNTPHLKGFRVAVNPRTGAYPLANDFILLSMCNHSVLNYGTFGAAAALFAGGTTLVFDVRLPQDGRGFTLASSLTSSLTNWFLCSDEKCVV